jgi:predicted N-formylglutamate amidohydrolase
MSLFLYSAMQLFHYTSNQKMSAAPHAKREMPGEYGEHDLDQDRLEEHIQETSASSRATG